jgi:hypothetical protein
MTGLGSDIYYLEFLQDLHYLLIDKFQAANNDINLLSESHALLQLLPKKDPATDTRLEKLDARLKDLHAKSELIQKQIEACGYAALIPHHKKAPFKILTWRLLYWLSNNYYNICAINQSGIKHL